VDFFFILSGFIIFHAHQRDFNQPQRLGAYLKKRFLRVFPTYWLVLPVVYGMAMAVPQTRALMPTSPLMLAKCIFLLPQYMSTTDKPYAPILTVAWSLQYEIIFYAAIALLILNRFLFFGAFLLYLGNFIYSHIVNAGFPLSFFASSWTLLFIMGAGTYFLHKSAMRICHPRVLVAAGIAGFLILAVLEAVLQPRDLAEPLRLAYGFLGSVIVLGSVRAEDVAPLPLPKGALILGNASYALYLIHFPLLSVSLKILVSLGLSGRSGALFSYFLLIALCISASVLFYQMVEKPLLRWLNREGSRSPLAVSAARA